MALHSRDFTNHQLLGQTLAIMTEGPSAPCPKCRTEMVYVTHLPHRLASRMQKTTFVCYTCNQTRSYALSTEIAATYAAICAPTNS